MKKPLKNRLNSYENLSRGLRRSLKPVTKATLAVGTGLLAGIPVAEAATVYSGLQNLDVTWTTGNGEAFVNFNGGANDLRFYGVNSANQPAMNVIRNIGDVNALSAYPNGSGYYLVHARSSSSVFEAGDPWRVNTNQTLANSRYNEGAFRTLPNGSTRFIGVRITEDGCQKYGWVRVTKNNSRSYTIVDWAYDDACDTPISPAVLLPVELLHFTASIAGKGTNLNWATATETTNAGFDVERSTDGEHFESVGFVEGNGNSTIPNDYRYYDDNLREAGTYYYRLKQIDFDGSHRYSDLQKVDFAGGNGQAVLISPNPSSGRFNVTYTAAADEELTMSVLDSGGKLVRKIQRLVSQGNNELVLSLEDLKAAVYFLKFETPTEQRYERIIIK